MKYAVISSMMREEIKPFAGCYKIVRETNSTVWVEVAKARGETETERFPKSRVMFYSERDISPAITMFNELVNQSYVKHQELVKHAINLVKLEGKKK